MVAKSSNIFFICSYIILTESTSFVNRIPKKCSVHDSNCLKSLLQVVLKDIAKNGIPEHKIPATDPYLIKNVTVRMIDQVYFTIIDGAAKGIRNCLVNKFTIDIERQHSVLELSCDLNLKAKYEASGSSPLLRTLLGRSKIHAAGTCKLAIQKFRLLFDFNFLIRERNGETFIDCLYQDLKYTYDIKKVTFSTDGGIYMGEIEATGPVINFLNDQWKFIMGTFGKPYLDSALDMIYEHAHRFFEYTPTKSYLTEDLTLYVTKDEKK